MIAKSRIYKYNQCEFVHYFSLLLLLVKPHLQLLFSVYTEFSQLCQFFFYLGLELTEFH